MTLLITESEVRTILADRAAMTEAMAAVERVMVEHAEGRLSLTKRIQTDHPPGSASELDGRSLRLMPCIAPSLDAAAVRVYTTHKVGDPTRAAPCELILLFEHHSMRLRAIIEDYSLHTLRTAAPTGVATQCLARADAQRVGVIGTSRHARGQLAAVASVRKLRDVRVFGRDEERRERFCAECTAALDLPVHASRRPQDAVAGADIVIVATSTNTPALLGHWLEPGTHVNSIAPGELDEEVLARAHIFPCHAQELIDGVPRWQPIPEMLAAGRLLEKDLADELGAVLVGRAAGRGDESEITLFLSTGMACWDLAIATWVDECARARGLGTMLWDDELGRSVTGLAAPMPSLAI